MSWQEFWFGKQTTYAMACYRITYCVILLDTLINQIDGELFKIFGPDAIIGHREIISNSWAGQSRFDLLLLFGSNEATALTVIYSGLIIATFCLLFGFCSRLNAILIFFFILTMHNRCHLPEDGGDELMRICAGYLMFSNCGAALSIDNLIRQKLTGIKEERLYEPWLQRLMQIQMTIVYGITWLSKMAGADWLEGVAVYKAVRIQALMRFPVPEFMDCPLLYSFLTYMTLFIEFALGGLVWVMRFRYIILFLGVCMHLGIEYCTNIPGFEYITACFYWLFIEEKDLIKWGALIKERLPKRMKTLGAGFLKLLDRGCSWVAEELPPSVKKRLKLQEPIPWFVWMSVGIIAYSTPMVLCQSKVDLITAQEHAHRYMDRVNEEVTELADKVAAAEKSGDTSIAAIDLEKKYAGALWAKREFAGAEAAYLKALNALPQSESYRRSILMLDLASLYRDMNKSEESMRLYEQILKIDRENTPDDPAFIARDLTNLGFAQYTAGIGKDRQTKRDLFAQSEKNLREALKIIPPGALPGTRAACLNNLYFLLRDTGRKGEAEQALHEAQDADATLGRKPPFGWYRL